MYRNTQFRTKTQSTFRMKEVDSSLLVTLHRSIKAAFIMYPTGGGGGGGQRILGGSQIFRAKKGGI